MSNYVSTMLLLKVLHVISIFVYTLPSPDFYKRHHNNLDIISLITHYFN